MEKARRRGRHVPAFGEWNYYSSSSPDEPDLPPSGGAAADWCWYAPEPEACSDVWIRYSPAPRKPAPRKARRPEVAPEKLYDAGVVAAARTPAKGSRRVVRPVDEDLYQVPPRPDSVSGRPRRKRAARSLWMGCFGLNCVA